MSKSILDKVFSSGTTKKSADERDNDFLRTIIELDIERFKSDTIHFC